jgi:hypothetical protein
MSTSSEKPPLDPALRRLVEAEQRRPPPAGQRLDRVFERVCGTLALPGSGVRGDGAPEGTGGTGRGASSSPAVKLLGVVGAAAVLAGIGYYAASRPRVPGPALEAKPPRERPDRAVHPAQVPEGPVRPLKTVKTVSSPAASAPIIKRPARLRPTAPRPVPKRRDAPADLLAAERRLLDEARQALSRGDGAEALRVVAVHRRRFPRGQLVEERQALQILGLVRAGRNTEARDAGLRFGERYPGSIMLAVVKDALSKLPGEAP